MMGEARYNGTNITWRKAVKFMLFRCEIELKDASTPTNTNSRGAGLVKLFFGTFCHVRIASIAETVELVS